MDRSKLFDVGGISALVFAFLGTASVIIWHSRLILFIFIALAALSFLVAVFAVLLGLYWRNEERARKSQTQSVSAPYKKEPSEPLQNYLVDADSLERIKKDKGNE